MADCNKNFCVKCEENIGEVAEDKIIKCNTDSCKGCLHYNCSTYNASELQFLESNKSNIKWFCDDCIKDECDDSTLQCFNYRHFEDYFNLKTLIDSILHNAKYACIFLLDNYIEAIEKQIAVLLKRTECESSSDCHLHMGEQLKCIC